MSTLASGPVVCLVGGMYSYTVTTTVPHGACGVYELLYVCGIGADCVWTGDNILAYALWAQCRPVPLPRHGSACGVVVRTRVPWCFCLQRPYMYHSPHPGAVSSKPYAYCVRCIGVPGVWVWDGVLSPESRPNGSPVSCGSSLSLSCSISAYCRARPNQARCASNHCPSVAEVGRPPAAAAIARPTSPGSSYTFQ